MHALRYVVCDVFTSEPLSGNALAVFTDASGITDRAMQALAREVNLSESVFVSRATQGGHARIRIFTPTRELPFAGHPVLGAAVVLGLPMQLGEIRLETAAGIVPVRLERDHTQIMFGWMSQPIPRVASFADTAGLFRALGVTGSLLPVALYDIGIRHLFIRLSTHEAVAAVQPDWQALAAIEAGINLFAGEGKSYKTRMFAPAYGVSEDPATGSAAGPLAVHLARHGCIGFGDEIIIEQGQEVRRPSRLYARAHGTPELLERVEVGGSVILVARGEFRLNSLPE
jgi:trans-2,3-dihydro-3-hydroxyanthranilate isomerase